ncbi:MAG TPA: hypothetical protein VMN99_11595 [Anaerolineales bacterium]|nr:hypothetical protein [Anaerolineales bacterium]
MSKTFYFVAIYRTNFVKRGRAKLVFSSTKIEFVSSSRTYQIPIQKAFKFPDYEERTIVKATELKLDEGQTYVEIMTQTSLTDPQLAQDLCEKNVDNSATLLATIYGPYFLDSLVYRGWLIKDGWGILHSWIQPTNQPKINIREKGLSDMLNVANTKIGQGDDISARFPLMAKFFAKSLLYSMSEEKFLLLWTILEIYPMKSTSNIKPISDCLSKILNLDADTIKEKLEIGKLYGLRSSLVHDGIFDVDMETIEKAYDNDVNLGRFRHKSEILGKLECIVHEVLRSICGLPYSGSLDRYLE